MFRVNGMAYTLKERYIKSRKQDRANYQKVLWRWRQLRGEEASFRPYSSASWPIRGNPIILKIAPTCTQANNKQHVLLL
jgi:hypothetical protein